MRLRILQIFYVNFVYVKTSYAIANFAMSRNIVWHCNLFLLLLFICKETWYDIAKFSLFLLDCVFVLR